MSVVCGVDEVGRGCLAGPLVAAAVVLRDVPRLPDELRDSKRLTRVARERLFPIIMKTACSVGLSIISADRINREGLTRANATALAEAAESACHKYPHAVVLVDGNPVSGWGREHEAVVHGDARSAAIAAASVVAKVLRDRLMRFYHRLVPCYGFDRHVGYGTAHHRTALRVYGLSEFHRYYAR